MTSERSQLTSEELDEIIAAVREDRLLNESVFRPEVLNKWKRVTNALGLGAILKKIEPTYSPQTWGKKVEETT